MKKLLLGLSLVILGFGCAKESNSATVNTATGYQLTAQGYCIQTSNGQQVAQSYCSNVNSGFQMNAQGQCIQISTGQIVNQQYCSTSGNTQYQYNNYGYCIQISTGQYVPQQYCQQSQGGQQCYGTYIYSQNGQQMYVNCQGYNCSGYALIQVSTNQQVYCQ